MTRISPPFESDFLNTFRQAVIDIDSSQISSSFTYLDEDDNVEKYYITDVLITSNDPRYELVVDSFFIFEFDENGISTDSELVELYPNNHMIKAYIGDYENIYQNNWQFDLSQDLPLYYDYPLLDETDYFDIMDERGNNYYSGEQLLFNEAGGLYTMQFNPNYDVEFYYLYQYTTSEQEKIDLIQALNPFPLKHDNIYLSWADVDSYKEWHSINQANINLVSISVSYEYLDPISEDYSSINFDKNNGEFEVRQGAIEYLYPFDINERTGTFTLSRDYSLIDSNYEIRVEGFYKDLSSVTDIFTPQLTEGDELTITLDVGEGVLSQFETISVTILFTGEADSDFTQVRLAENAKNAHSESQYWSKNDSLIIEYEYRDLDYFLLMEDYQVGSEDSSFEYIEYLRNEDFVKHSEFYSLAQSSYKAEFENFAPIEDKSTVLELQDMDQNGQYEYIIEKSDLTGEGAYNSFKYGSQDAAGEISFHTLIQKSTSISQSVEKHDDIRATDEFELNEEGFLAIARDLWADFCRKYTIKAKKEITSHATVVTRNFISGELIQKDLDGDGTVDVELSHETRMSLIQSSIYTQEDTSITYTPTIYFSALNWFAESHEAVLREGSYNNITQFGIQSSMVFRDFEGEEVTSTRAYFNTFPNELSISYDLNEQVGLLTNDLGDDDPSNDITTEAPALEKLLKLSHESDKVPASYDQKFTLENGEIISENILSTKKVINIPGYYKDLYGMDSFEVDVIEVIPDKGVLLDINDKGSSTARVEGSYCYFDSNGDLSHETVFVLDKYGNTIGIGFDYDGNNVFSPEKLQLVKRQVVKQQAEGFDDTFDIETIKSHSFINFGKEGTGWTLEPSYGDTYFPLWKMDFSAQTSQLIEEAERITANEVLEQYNDRFWDDVIWQVGAQLAGIAGWLFLGPVGYFGGYFVVSMVQSLVQEQQVKNEIKAYTFTPSGAYKEPKQLTQNAFIDDLFRNIPTTPISGTSEAIYGTARKEIEGELYEASIVLAPYNGEGGKTLVGWDDEGLGITYYSPKLDFSLQTRNYLVFSDLENSNLHSYLSERDGIFYNTDPELMHVYQSISATENLLIGVSNEAYDSVIPIMVEGVPMFDFESSTGSFELPEFYMDDPIYLPNYEVQALQQQEQFHSVYKICGENTFEEDHSMIIQVVPSDSRHGFKLNLTEVSFYLYTGLYGYETNEYLGTLYAESFEYDPITGILTINSDITSTWYDKWKVKKDISDSMTFPFPVFIFAEISVQKFARYSEKVSKQALMQAVQGSILEYFYQFNLASQTESQLQEIVYTIKTTVTSLIITTGIVCAAGKVLSDINLIRSIAPLEEQAIISSPSIAGELFPKMYTKFLSRATALLLERNAGITAYTLIGACISESLQEVFVDPWLETIMEQWTIRLGLPRWVQIAAAHLSESIRETAIGGVVNLLGLRKSSQMTFSELVEMKYGCVYLTGKELINEFKAYKEDIKSQLSHKSTLAKIGGLLLSTIGLFSTAWMGSVLSPFIGSALSASISSLLVLVQTDDQLSLKGLLKHLKGVPTTDSELTSEGISGIIEKEDKFTYNLERSRASKVITLAACIGMGIVSGLLFSLLPHQVPTMLKMLFVLPFTGMMGIAASSRQNPQDYHVERRFILKLMLAFLEISSYQSKIKLPGYFKSEDESLADTFRGARSGLNVLGETIKNLAGDFYRFGESLFKETWYEKSFLKQATINKLEHFILYTRGINQGQVRIVLDAIDQYRKERGYDTRKTHECEHDLIWDLHAALSSQLGRYVSLREMGIMFKGRDAAGTPLGDDFFYRRVQGTPMKIRQDSLGELMLWIENPITWEHKGVMHAIKLQATNLELARQALLAYNSRVYHSKNVYIVDENAPNVHSLRMVNLLLSAYSKNEFKNPNYGKKGITFRQLFEGIIGKYRTFFRYQKDGKEFAKHLIEAIIRQVNKDGMSLFAPTEYYQLMKEIKDLYPYYYYEFFGGRRAPDAKTMRYFTFYEPRMKAYAKLARLNPQIRTDDLYYPGFLSNTVLRQEQNRILIRQWGNRNPLDGREIQCDANGYPTEQITRHHWRVSDHQLGKPINKLDCSIAALVPIPTAEHFPSSTPHTTDWERRFRIAKIYLDQGIPVVPSWWNTQNQNDYKKWLKANEYNYYKTI